MEKIQGDSLNNIYKFFNVLSISIFVIVVSVNVNAQFSGTVNYGMLYDDNPFRETNGSEELVNSFSTGLNYQPFDKEFYSNIIWVTLFLTQCAST